MSNDNYTVKDGIPLEMLQSLHASLENILNGGQQAAVCLQFTRQQAMNASYGKFMTAILTEAQSFIETRWPLQMDRRVALIDSALALMGMTPEGVFQAETRVLGFKGEPEQFAQGVMQINFEACRHERFIIFNVVADISFRFAEHQINTHQNFILGVHYYPET